MKKLITTSGVYGPYSEIIIGEDRYNCDGADLPFSVVGGLVSVSDWDMPMPEQINNHPTAHASVSPRQIRMALTRLGLRETVESAVKSGSQDLKDWWEFAIQIDRHHPLVLQMAVALNVSDAQLDELWVLAASL